MKLFDRSMSLVTVALLAVLPAVALLTNTHRWIAEGHSGSDLKIAYLGAAKAVLHGRSPYLSPHDPAVEAGIAYVYPPVLAFVTVPLTIVPSSVIVGVGMVTVALLIPMILVIAGIRDWRCIGAAMLWPAVSNEVQTLNVSILVAFLLAIAWRTRGRQLTSGLSIGAILAVKLFTWPLLVWPLALRRTRTTATAISSAAVLILGSWAAIGFDGFAQYPELLNRLSAAEASNSYSLYGAADVFGLGNQSAGALALLATAALIAWCIRVGRQGDDRRSFAAAVLASLAFAPIVWHHYFLLLLIALAVVRPSFSAVWLLPLLMWVAPQSGNNGSGFQTLIAIGTASAVAAACLLDPGDHVERTRRESIGASPQPRA